MRIYKNAQQALSPCSLDSLTAYHMLDLDLAHSNTFNSKHWTRNLATAISMELFLNKSCLIVEWNAWLDTFEMCKLFPRIRLIDKRQDTNIYTLWLSYVSRGNCLLGITYQISKRNRQFINVYCRFYFVCLFVCLLECSSLLWWIFFI